jgi:adenine-specific DNA-methyltransferase
MIYIDPPYNTGNDSFVYPDDYTERLSEYKRRTGLIDENGFINKQDLWRKNSKESGQYHSVWLSMMYPRLYLAKNLLHKDGVIFISIDENEVANLTLLCNEVFGPENFIGCAARVTKKSNNKGEFWAPNFDYVLSYTKNKEYAKEFFGGANIEAYDQIETDFTTITQQEIDIAMERLNNRPRKRLGYQTPSQVFFRSGVALHI